MTEALSSVTLFLDTQLHEKGLSSATILAYDNELKRAFQYSVSSGEDWPNSFCAYCLSQVSRGLSRATQRRTRAALSVFLDWAVKQGMCSHNPIRELPRVLPPASGFKALSDAQAARLVEAPTGKRRGVVLRNRALLELAYGSGLRAAELSNLMTHHVNLVTGAALLQGKGNKERMVPLSEACHQALKDWIEYRAQFMPKTNAKWVFSSSKGAHLTPNGVWRVVKAAGRSAGFQGKLPSPHSLRHSFATELVNNGADLRVVQLLMGHESISTTTVYLKPSPTRLKYLHKKHHPRG